LRFATIDRHFWELESGEERQAKSGGKFWLPPLEHRSALRAGQLAKLLFLIEGETEEGTLEVQVERMWVLVTRILGEAYVSRLINQPASMEPSDKTYLILGAEVPFKPEHVIDIHEWAQEDVSS
jgi:hypothetical protein